MTKCVSRENAETRREREREKKESTSAEPFAPHVNIDLQLYFLAGNSDFLATFTPSRRYSPVNNYQSVKILDVIGCNHTFCDIEQ